MKNFPTKAAVRLLFPFFGLVSLGLLKPGSSFCAGAPDAFIQSGFGARGPGMAGAYTALADDVAGIYWNPAGLSRMTSPEFTTMYSPNQLEVHRSFLGAGIPIRGWGTFAVGFYRLGSNGIELTNDTQAIGFDDLSNDAYYISWGSQIGSHFHWGTTAKRLSFSFGSFDESGWGADLGAQYDWHWLKLGGLFQDAIQTHLTANSVGGGTVSDDVPRRIRTGVALTWPEEGRPIQSVWEFPVRITVSMDGVFPLQGEEQAQAIPGAEIWIADRVAVRTGYVNQEGPTWGAGVRFTHFTFDYAILVDPDLANQNRFSFSIYF